MKEQMINYLQGMMNAYKEEKAKYGASDRRVLKKWNEMYACKQMVESLIGEPVKLGIDGKVTVGF